MSISIIVPCYNPNIEDLNKNIILIDKINLDKEVILVNDGSSNGFGNKILSRDYVKVVDKINGGVSSARNFGIDNATKDYIFFLDADDEITTEFIDFLNTKFNFVNDDWIIFDILINSLENMYKRVLPHSDNYVETMLLTTDINECWGKLIKTKFLTENNIRFDVNLIQGEDWLFNIMIAKSATIKKIDITSYVYNFNGNNIGSRSVKNTKKYLESAFILANEKRKYLSELNSNNEKQIKKKINSYIICSLTNPLVNMTKDDDYKNILSIVKNFRKSTLRLLCGYTFDMRKCYIYYPLLKLKLYFFFRFVKILRKI